MKRFFLFLLPLQFLFSNSANDQALVIFGSGGYVLYKVLDFANDHGYRYIKILSYTFKEFEHEISCRTTADAKKGRAFQIDDDYAAISFLCYEQKPDDIYIIDLEKYRLLLEDLNCEKE